MKSGLYRFFLTLGSLSWYFFAALVGFGLAYWWVHTTVFSPIDPGDERIVPFLVEKGWNMKTISRELEKQNLVKHHWVVYYLSRFKETEDGKLKVFPGEYALSKSYTPIKLLQTILSGEFVYHDLTLVEGASTKDLPALMEKTTLVTQAEAKAALASKDLLAMLSIPSSSFEGYLFPETYRFSRPEDATAMIQRMVKEHKERIPQSYYERAVDLGFTFHQILTLASVIEKETAVGTERPLISSVFHNRLRIGMPLQSDPTVIYGLKNFDGNLTKRHLTTPSKYNTYLNTGLPPTPIANPGLESIKAALFPADTEYLYFVAKNDGTHFFSATYKEHRRAVDKYQRQRAGKAPLPEVTQKKEAPKKKAVTKPKKKPAPKKTSKKKKDIPPGSLSQQKWPPISQIDPIKEKKRPDAPELVDPAQVIEKIQ